jgi:hypothetical protein
MAAEAAARAKKDAVVAAVQAKIDARKMKEDEKRKASKKFEDTQEAWDCYDWEDMAAEAARKTVWQ